MKIVVASDIHGNEQHLFALQKLVSEEKPDIFMYLGDFSPNRFLYPNPQQADKYNQEIFFPIIQSLKAKKKYVIPGNTDFQVNHERYQELYNTPDNIEYILEGVRSLNKNVDVLFYHYTTFSPHSLKDGEKFDQLKIENVHSTTRIITEHETVQPRQRNGSFSTSTAFAQDLIKQLENVETFDEIDDFKDLSMQTKIIKKLEEKTPSSGVVSGYFNAFCSHKPSQNNFYMSDALEYDQKYFQKVDLFDQDTQPVWFQQQIEYTIEQSIRFQLTRSYSLLFDTNFNKKIKIWAFHGPAYLCNDKIRSGQHVGSKGMRSAFHDYPPNLIISGHVHETCMDGNYKILEDVKNTQVTMCAVGNEPLIMPFCLKASFLIINLNDKGEVLKTQRRVLEVDKYKDADDAFIEWKKVSDKLRKI